MLLTKGPIYLISNEIEEILFSNIVSGAVTIVNVFFYFVGHM